MFAGTDEATACGAMVGDEELEAIGALGRMFAEDSSPPSSRSGWLSQAGAAMAARWRGEPIPGEPVVVKEHAAASATPAGSSATSALLLCLLVARCGASFGKHSGHTGGCQVSMRRSCLVASIQQPSVG